VTPALESHLHRRPGSAISAPDVKSTTTAAFTHALPMPLRHRDRTVGRVRPAARLRGSARPRSRRARRFASRRGAPARAERCRCHSPAACAPAMRPNTAPDIRPEPPG
jgi:hypothetical protein